MVEMKETRRRLFCNSESARDRVRTCCECIHQTKVCRFKPLSNRTINRQVIDVVVQLRLYRICNLVPINNQPSVQ